MAFSVNFAGAGFQQALASGPADFQQLPPHLQNAPSQGGSGMEPGVGTGSGGKMHKKKFSHNTPKHNPQAIRVSIGPGRDGRRTVPAPYQPSHARTNNRTIWISNPASVTREDMLTALQTGCSEQFAITEYLVNRDSMLFTIDNDRALNALLRLSKKLIVKGQHIQISKTNKRPSGMRTCLKKETVLHIEECLGHRFAMADKALVLTSLVSDASLASMCPNSTVSPSLWDATADIVAQYCPDLDLLDISTNNISSLYPLKRLFECCPELKKLALSNNQLKRAETTLHAEAGDWIQAAPCPGPPCRASPLLLMLQSIEDFSHLRALKKLEQLFVSGNPFAATLDRATLEQRMRKYVPTLTVLDGVAMQPVADQLLPPLGSSYVPPAVAEIVEQFGTKFFTLFDNDRLRLLNVYDDDSFFSVTVAHNVNLRGASELKHQSRDLLHNFGRQKLTRGASKILELFMKLPKTSHDLQSLTVDVFRLNDADLCVNVMGSLSDEWSFHRCFILRPAAPGSTATTQGWAVVIRNDQLTILSRAGKSRGAVPSGIAAAAIAAAHQN